MKRVVLNVVPVVRMMFCRTTDRAAIFAASSKSLTRDMARVKSSNIWAYKINVTDEENDIGDVYVQFKGRDGGPDDIYVYYDVPVRIYRRWLGAPSKGHYFWQYIRNNFKYHKLTGDKIGKLPNAVN